MEVFIFTFIIISLSFVGLGVGVFFFGKQSIKSSCHASTNNQPNGCSSCKPKQAGICPSDDDTGALKMVETMKLGFNKH
jgi:hypothetical protein